MKLIAPFTGVALVLSLSAFGCGGSDAPAKDPSTVAIDNTSTTTASTMTPPPNAQDSNMDPQAGDTAPAANPKNASDAAMAPSTLSDGDIAAITNAANQGEIDQAKLALKKAKNAKVKKFAQMMIEHHSAAMSDQTKLVTNAKITPSSNPTSQQIGTDGATALSTLQGDSGSDFDKAYIDLQVKEHQDVLNTIDQKLIPNAQNADLKAALVAFEPKVSEHLKKAQALQTELSK